MRAAAKTMAVTLVEIEVQARQLLAEQWARLVEMLLDSLRQEPSAEIEARRS